MRRIPLRGRWMLAGLLVAVGTWSACQRPAVPPPPSSASQAAARSAPATATDALPAEARQRVITRSEPETTRGFQLRNDFLTMDDGTRLAVSYYFPADLRDGERLPVVLSATPYRKDDQMFTVYYHLYPYFAKRGIVVAHVDIRGSGSSGGATIDREYSDAELDDMEQVIAQLAAKPWSNGNIGMMGKSWSGFNAIMLAMRRPPALKAILVAHASQDLYRNDIHYIDGILHYDIWALEMEADTLAPRWPGYPLDDEYFRDRFERTPWTMTYLRHQRDGPWWQSGRSLQSDWAALDVPVYAIGGLQDGYRDYVIEVLNNADVPVWAEIGPWGHYWPQNGWSAPHYEWRQTAVRWWQHWLGDDPSWPFEGKTLTVFQRGTGEPTGSWWWANGNFEVYDWPLQDAGSTHWVPQAGRMLVAEGAPGMSPDAAASTDELRYVPGSGIAAGGWWGDMRGDMRSADRHALVYTSPPLDEPTRILGMPEVQLAVTSTSPNTNWIARLEDVRPSGRSTMVTGGALNGAQRASTTSPQPFPVDRWTTARFPMHFTTYTFAPGHSVRLVVTNAQFPMLWPTPDPMTATLQVGGDPATGSFLDLPTAPPGPVVSMPQPVERGRPAPRAAWPIWHSVGPYRVLQDDPDGLTRVAEHEGGRLIRNGNVVDYLARDERWVDNTDPARAGLEGVATERYHLPGRIVTVRAAVSIESDADFFHVTIERAVLEDGHVVAERTFEDDIPRDHQ